MAKIGIVGTGLVGATAAYALVMRGIGSEIVLVDKDSLRASAEANDILHAVPFAHPTRVRAGEFSDLEGCTIVIIAAGTNQKPGETRLELLGRNAKIFQSIIPKIMRYSPRARLIVATNPVDIMTHMTARFAAKFDVPPEHVMGSGTTLDTARFRTLLSNHLGVAAHNIHGYVLGEHGDSEILAWSLVTVGVIPLMDFCRARGIELSDSTKGEIDSQVRRAAYSIIEGKGATYYGIGGALAGIVDAIVDDQRALLTVSTPVKEVVGVRDVTMALPHIVGREGIGGALPLPLSQEEENRLKSSALVIRGAIDELEKILVI